MAKKKGKQRKKRITASRRYDTETVQGPGSYVRLRTQLCGTAPLNAFLAAKALGKTVPQQITDDVLIYAIVGWNWVDRDDQPLALPRDSPKIWEGLGDEEYLALLAVFEKHLVNIVETSKGDDR